MSVDNLELFSLLDGEVDLGRPPPPPPAPPEDEPKNGKVLEVNGGRYWIKLGSDAGGSFWSVFVAETPEANYNSMDRWRQLYLTSHERNKRTVQSCIGEIPQQVFDAVGEMFPGNS